MSDTVSKEWYVIHTYSGYENKVKTDLEKMIKNRELQDYFFDIMKKYEKKFPELKEVNPKFLLEMEKWLIENQWIEPIEQA